MSAIKTSQIHDGFATIRSRGLQRSRSRAEQLERLKPISMKCDSFPVYENAATTIHHNNNNNNNNLDAKNKNEIADHQIMYKFENFSGSPEMPTLMSSSLQSEAQLLKSVDDFQLNTINKPVSCGTFKNATSQSQLSTSDQSSSIDANDRSSLPPPSPSYETYSTNDFHSPTKTPPESMRNSTLADYFLYVRPTSPIYESYASVGSHTSSSSPDGLHASPDTIMYNSLPPSSNIFQTSYYSKSDALDGYALQKIPKKTLPLNYKAQSLQYRKSYSHPKRTTIHETTVTAASINKFNRGIRNYYNSTTNYYDPNEINYMGLYGMMPMLKTMHKPTARSSELLNDCNDIERTKPNVKRNESFKTRQNNSASVQRPYATLAHPRDAQQRQQHRQFQSEQQRKYASNELTTVQNDFDYLDPLDCKVGCQTTLRSKPQIPWYELAIKKDSRRQSCPAIQVN